MQSSRPLSVRLRRAAAVATLGSALLIPAFGGCDHRTIEERARETAEKMQKSIVDVEGIALEQKAPSEVVSEVQRNLTVIHEYQGEINGKLDSVTINAIQAFQRTAGLKDSGIITETTRKKLAAAAGAAPHA